MTNSTNGGNGTVDETLIDRQVDLLVAATQAIVDAIRPFPDWVKLVVLRAAAEAVDNPDEEDDEEKS